MLQELREIILSCVPGAGERITYGIPTVTLNGNLVHYAAYKNHIGFYPGANGIKTFQKEYLSYRFAKGSVQFPLSDPLPYALIKEVVAFRVKENSHKVSKAKG